MAPDRRCAPGVVHTPRMDPGRVETSLAAARDHREACAAVVEHLATRPGYKPSVYLERGGRLRCQAARTYLQVLDGIPPGVGILGRTFASGQVSVNRDVSDCEYYLEITPQVKAEICAPVAAGGDIVGVLNVESLAELGHEAVPEIVALAEALGNRLAELGGGLRETPAQRLGRHATRLTEAKSRRRAEREVLDAAADVAGMESAALLSCAPDGTVTVIDAVGLLAPVLEAAPQEALGVVVGFAAPGTSCFTVGESGGQDFEGLMALREAGVGALAILALSEAPSRVLLVADPAPHEIATDLIELLELLCAHAASALRASDFVHDLRVQADTDPLTGLGHHRTFHARLQADRTPHPVAVLVVDLDDFKSVNDTAGHLAGDRLLREVARILEAAVRDDDDLFRVGGDEFTVLARAGDHAEALEVAMRLSAAVREHSHVTASVGVSLARSDESLSEALLRADRALYAAKGAGRDRAVLADD